MYTDVCKSSFCLVNSTWFTLRLVVSSVTCTAIPYTVRVVSGAPPVCDPAPFLVIILIGQTQSSQPIKLNRLNSTGFVSGRPETFSVECKDVGPLSSLKVHTHTVAPLKVHTHTHTAAPLKVHTHTIVFAYIQQLIPFFGMFSRS